MAHPDSIVSPVDHLFAVASLSLRPALQFLGNLESRQARSQLQKTAIHRPVFICGLPRSGSTLLLEILARADDVVTHRYRDFPFPWLPLTWNRFQDRFGAAAPPMERAQADGVSITRDSPEAMEEPLWESFLPDLHHPARGHVVGAEQRQPDLERFLRDHIRKLLWLRVGRRYVSKGHYNATRIEWLARTFPDALFVVPVRHPVAQVASLVRCHERFLAAAEADRRSITLLRAAGHHEFGAARRPMNVVPYGTPIGTQLRDEGDAVYYARQWTSVYRFLWHLSQDSALEQRMHFLRYEDLCANPEEWVGRLFRFCKLEPYEGMTDSVHNDSAKMGGCTATGIWQRTGEVAGWFQYAWQ